MNEYPKLISVNVETVLTSVWHTDYRPVGYAVTAEMLSENGLVFTLNFEVPERDWDGNSIEDLIREEVFGDDVVRNLSQTIRQTRHNR